MMSETQLDRLVRNGCYEITSLDCVGYCRVSTKKQNYDLQKAAIKKFCDEHGLNIVRWYTEIISGAAPFENRTAILDAAKYCQENGFALVAYSYDRVSRSNDFIYKFFKSFEIDTIIVSNPQIKKEIYTLTDYWSGLYLRQGTSQVMG